MYIHIFKSVGHHFDERFSETWVAAEVTIAIGPVGPVGPVRRPFITKLFAEDFNERIAEAIVVGLALLGMLVRAPIVPKGVFWYIEDMENTFQLRTVDPWDPWDPAKIFTKDSKLSSLVVGSTLIAGP